MERAKKIPFLCAFFLIVFVSTIRLSTDILIASADTIRRLTRRIGERFYQNRSKKCENPSKSPLSAGFWPIFPFSKEKKYRRDFGRKHHPKNFSIF